MPSDPNTSDPYHLSTGDRRQAVANEEAPFHDHSIVTGLLQVNTTLQYSYCALPMLTAGYRVRRTIPRAMKMKQQSAAAYEGNGPSLAAGPWPCGLPAGTLACLADTLNKEWKNYRKRLKQCQRRFSERSVHELRIETRRLFSMMELLRPFQAGRKIEAAQEALKERLDAFDDLRDTQVQLVSVGAMRRRFAAAKPFYNHLRKCEQRFSKRTRKRIKGMKAKQLGALVTACCPDLPKAETLRASHIISDLLLRCVGRAFSRAKQLRDRVDSRDTATIHQTRIAFKRFRYMVETLADCQPVEENELLKQMRDYQALMGRIQDAEVLLKTWDKYSLKKEPPRKAAVAFRRQLLKERRSLIRGYLKEADRLLEFWPIAAHKPRRPARAAHSTNKHKSARPAPIPSSGSPHALGISATSLSQAVAH
ncbi:MAG: hypothetical protein C5B50_12720 [Verrucomicrobia bacterium]|nr:MAG: hypothetical protein C5B50_12720 [Verrucomicrobiota bacterium]